MHGSYASKDFDLCETCAERCCMPPGAKNCLYDIVLVNRMLREVQSNVSEFFAWRVVLLRISGWAQFGASYLCRAKRVCIFDKDWLGNACTRICFFIYFWWRIDLLCLKNMTSMISEHD